MFKGLKTVFACGSLALALAASLAFVSCDFGLDGNSFQNKAGAYFKEMTSTAAVSAYEISPSDNPVNKDGVACVSSDQDCVVTFYLRNPQKYRFNAPDNMTLALKGLDSYSGVEIEQDILDSSKIIVTYSAKFLFDHPMGTDISPLVTLYHPVSHSDFGTYTELPLSSDNLPPTPSGAVCMQTSDNPSRWVLCFDFPKSPLIKSIHRDLKKIEINGVSYDVGVDAEGNISYAAGSAIGTTKPAGLVANQNTGMSFVSSGQAAYYATGDAADENEKIYDITVYDNAGLSSNMKVSARGFKLSPAAAFLTTDTSYSNPFDTDVTRKNAVPQEDDGSAHIRIKADAFTSSVTYIDKDGNTRTIDSQPYDPSNAYILYEVYEDEAMTKLLGAGKLNGLTGLVTVPAGTSFVKAYVQKPLYSDSEPIVWNCRAVCANLFVASYGSDDNAGSKASPLASIKKAVQKFEEGISVGDYDGTSGAVLTAQLMTDISVSEQVVWNHPGTDDPEFRIAGYGERRTLDMAGSSATLLVSGGTALAENVRFYRASYSAVILSDSSSRFKCSGCAFEDCSNTGASGGAITVNNGWLEARTSSFERCKSLYDPGGMGGAVFVSGSGYADFEGCSIKNCYSVGDGSAIYCGGSLKIAACTITENTTQGDTGGAVYYQGPVANFTLDAGQSYIYGNKSLSGKEIDVHLTDGSGGGNAMSISGSLAGSQIGVYMPFSETFKPATGAPVMFTSNWSMTNSGMKPGEVFISNTEYGIAEAGTGTTEAAFAVGGGSMYNAFDYTFTMTKAAAAPEAMYPGMAVSYDVGLEVFRKEPTGSETPMHLNPADLMLYTGYSPYTGRDGDAAAILKAELYIGSRLVDDSLTVTAGDGKLTVAVPAQTYPDNYRIKLIVSYLGLSHTASFSLPCNHSAEAAAAYIQSLRAAGDYNVVVEGPVGAAVTDGLNKVADAIRSHGLSRSALDGVYITLDASATTNASSRPAYTLPYFKNCAALKSFVLPDWIEYVLPSLFEGCQSLSSVTLSANTQVIMQDAFNGCSSLAAIALPEKICGPNAPADPHGIQEGAFVGCADGFKIDFAGTKDQWSDVNRPDQTTNPWHVGGVEDSADDGSVTCSDGRCGLDVAPVIAYPNVMSLPDGTIPTAADYPQLAISSPEGFDRLATWAQTSALDGIEFTLLRDVTVSDDLLIKQFKGTFDGNGKSITQNFTITETSGNEKTADNVTIYKTYKAMFWSIQEGAVIKNLTVKGHSTTAGIVGYMLGGTVEDCVSETEISGNTFYDAHMGGVVSVLNQGTVKNCVNKGLVKSTRTGGNYTLGGVVASLGGTGAVVDSCINKGSVGVGGTTRGFVGGIVGDAQDSGGKILNCKNIGAVYGTTPGGITGLAERCYITNCSNIGTITEEDDSTRGSGLVSRFCDSYYAPKWPNLRNNCNGGDAYVGIIDHFDHSSDAPGSKPDSTCLEGNYSVIGESPYPTKLVNRADSTLTWYNDLTFDEAVMKGFSPSDYEDTLNALNDWVRNNTSETTPYKSWKLGARGPELNLGALDDK